MGDFKAPRGFWLFPHPKKKGGRGLGGGAKNSFLGGGEGARHVWKRCNGVSGGETKMARGLWGFQKNCVFFPLVGPMFREKATPPKIGPFFLPKKPTGCGGKIFLTRGFKRPKPKTKEKRGGGDLFFFF